MIVGLRLKVPIARHSDIRERRGSRYLGREEKKETEKEKENAMAAPCIYEHAHDAPILHILTKQLPHSISLLRRIQHGIAHPSSTAKILTTFPPSGPEPGSAVPPDSPWLAARVDLFRGRETQIIIYSSLESETSIQPLGPVTPSNTILPNDYVVSTLAADQPALNHARAQLLALLAYVKAHLRPLYLSSLDLPSSPALYSPTNQNATPLIPAPDPLAFLVGSFHAGLYTLLLRDGVFPSPGADPAFELPIPGLKIHRYDNPPYVKFFFRTAALQQDAQSGGVPLPHGYRYHDRRGRVGVLSSQLDLVQSRTHIPRSRAQLSVMPGVAVYWDGADGEDGKGRARHADAEDEMPVAWAFLGLDGPVATLHVEPEHRGKGLGLALCKETMRRGMDADGVFGAARAGIDGHLAGRVGDWMHAEVAQFNQASQRVMKKIGGEVLTTVMWTVIEVVD